MVYRQIYWIDIKHEGLKLFRRIRGTDEFVVKQKATVLQAQWEEKWKKKKKIEGEKLYLFNKTSEAVERTKKAQETLNYVRNTLQNTINVNDAINWDNLKLQNIFSKPAPDNPKSSKLPDEPQNVALTYKNPNWWQKLMAWPNKLPSKSKIQQQFESDHRKWKTECEKTIQKNLVNELNYKQKLKIWEEEKDETFKKNAESNALIDVRKEKYLSKDVNAIVDYCDLVLNNSIYIDSFPRDFEIDYIENTKTLIIEYRLPASSDIPTLSEVKYIKSQDKFKEYYISSSAANRLYDDTLYQITLRTIHEIFEADVVGAVDAISFNGWVKSIDKSTGQDINPCILSIQVTKDEFLKINLANIDPKVCFKALKGIGSSQLHELAPIQPILQIDKNDKRFVSGYNVVDLLSEGTNIAAISWEDFEQLIRELFEKEFNQSGGEVKVTRASRDGGVDAVAFDPDPIRGGKIVIQAKRYTNTVGVSAVRDLYGTVINEGATKGILITTADYGPDSYAFAKGKPLTLLTGHHLVHLLQKHGHKARIDLDEAKLLNSENQT